MHMFHIPQCTIQNRNVGYGRCALWDLWISSIVKHLNELIMYFEAVVSIAVYNDVKDNNDAAANLYEIINNSVEWKNLIQRTSRDLKNVKFEVQLMNSFDDMNNNNSTVANLYETTYISIGWIILNCGKPFRRFFHGNMNNICFATLKQTGLVTSAFNMHWRKEEADEIYISNVNWPFLEIERSHESVL